MLSAEDFNYETYNEEVLNAKTIVEEEE